MFKIEVHERVRYIRKYFRLSQEAFGKRLGVTRDVIGNIELNRLAKPEQKLSLLKLICSEFSINEAWLIDGQGDMFVDTKDAYIDGLVKRYELDDMDTKIIQAYVELPESHRMVIKSYLKSITSILGQPKDNQDEIDIEKELELYRQELEAEKKASGKFTALQDFQEEKNA